MSPDASSRNPPRDSFLTPEMSHPFKLVTVGSGLAVAGWLVGFFMSAHSAAPAAPGQREISAEHRSSAFTLLPPSASELPGSTNETAQNRESAIVAALREPNDMRRTHDLMEAVGRMGLSEISSALARARDLPAPDREALAPVLVARWAEIDPAAAARFTLTLPESVLRSLTIRATLGVWIASSPDAAMAWADSLPAGRQRSRMIADVVRALARRNPAGALDFLERFPKDPARNHSSFNVLSEWAQSDPRAAADHWLKALPASGQDANGALARIAPLWARRDPDEALAWARALPESPAKNNTLGSIIGAMAGNDPQEAAARLGQLPSASRAGATGQVALQWAQKDAAAAAAWAGGLSEGGARASAFRSIAQTWTGQDLVKTADWLDRLPASRSRDAAVSAFTRQVTDSDPESAMAWAETISDATTRTGDLERIALTWMGQDQEAARRWIAATPALAEEAKTRLLSVPK
jgi:hypothetical protein